MMVISERSSLEEEKNTTVFTNSRKNKHKYILSGAHYSNNNQYILGSKNIHHQISTQKEVKRKKKTFINNALSLPLETSNKIGTYREEMTILFFLVFLFFIFFLRLYFSTTLIYTTTGFIKKYIYTHTPQQVIHRS